jgi:hypothetical protein
VDGPDGVHTSASSPTDTATAVTAATARGEKSPAHAWAVLSVMAHTVVRMLVVKIELWPGGAADRAREIGRPRIANVSDLAEVSD